MGFMTLLEGTRSHTSLIRISDLISNAMEII